MKHRKSFFKAIFSKKKKPKRLKNIQLAGYTSEGKKLGRGLSILFMFFSPLYFALTLACYEIIFHVSLFENTSFLFPVLFAVPVGIAVGLICDIFEEKTARILRYVFAGIFIIVYGTQIVYKNIFSDFVSFSLVGLGGDAISNFWKSVLIGIWDARFAILFLIMPVVLLILWHRYLNPQNIRNAVKYSVGGVLAAVLYVFVVLLLPTKGKLPNSHYDIYHNYDGTISLSIEKLGVLPAERLDIVRSVFGGTQSVEKEAPQGVDIDTKDKKADEGSKPAEATDVNGNAKSVHVIDGLDFAAIAESQDNETVKAICEYLDGLTPTSTNKYTGMFEGYNLIMLCAESFSPAAVNEEYTPTLYKLVNNGFVFNNFWTTYPSNTTNGEYSFLTGLFPDFNKPKSNGSFLYTAKNNITMNLNMASFMNSNGLTSRAYHAHYGSYYSRNETHPNLGYEFKGREQIGKLNGWPESDLVMIERTVGDYIGEDRFFTYYMTVSGHHNYKINGLNSTTAVNSIAEKNKGLIKEFAYCASLKAYMACHIELDRALEKLINELTESGKLDKTVICLCPDHYPYGLTDSEYKQYLGHNIKYDGLERHESNLIIWNSAMEKVEINKPCCTVDVLPTLLNLFGYDYDSRLYSGTDILSDSMGLAITANKSFMTSDFIYNSRTGKVYNLTDDENWSISDDDLKKYIQLVDNRFRIASNILNYDLYAKLPQDIIEEARKNKLVNSDGNGVRQLSEEEQKEEQQQNDENGQQS